MELLVSVAADLRCRSGQDRPAFSTRAIVRQCFPNTVVTGRRLPPGILEVVSMTSEGPIIIYSRDMSGARQRFAIAHAMAHLLFDLDDPDTVCRPQFVGESKAEARADAFAAELLVPTACLRPLITRVPPLVPDGPDHEIYLDTVDGIASMFHVPSWVVDKQIRELISRGEFS